MAKLNLKDALNIALSRTKQYVDNAIDDAMANAGPNIVMLSQAEYDALGDNIDSETLYIIG